MDTSNISSCNKSLNDSSNCKSTPKGNSKPSGGKILVRTDIENVNTSCNLSISGEGTNHKPSSENSHKSIGKTASISVIPSEELLETRHRREDTTPPVTVYNKLSVVPAQQLLETNHQTNLSAPSAFTLQMAYSDDSNRQQPRIKLTKPSLDQRNRDVSCDARNAVDSISSASNLLSDEFCDDTTMMHTPTNMFGGEEEVLVLPSSDTNFDSVDMRSESFCADNEAADDFSQSLQVVFTSSHQHNMNSSHYSYSPCGELDSIDDTNCDTILETTPIKDTAKTQWATLHQQQNMREDTSHHNDITESKIKKCLFTDSSISHPNVGDEDLVFVSPSPSTVSISPSPSPAVTVSSQTGSAFQLFSSTFGDQRQSCENPSSCPVIQIDETELSECHEQMKSIKQSSFTPEPRPSSEPVCLTVGSPSYSSNSLETSAMQRLSEPTPNNSTECNVHAEKSSSLKGSQFISNLSSHLEENSNSSIIQVDVVNDTQTHTPDTSKKFGKVLFDTPDSNSQRDISRPVTFSSNHTSLPAVHRSDVEVRESESETIFANSISPDKNRDVSIIHSVKTAKKIVDAEMNERFSNSFTGETTFNAGNKENSRSNPNVPSSSTLENLVNCPALPTDMSVATSFNSVSSCDVAANNTSANSIFISNNLVENATNQPNAGTISIASHDSLRQEVNLVVVTVKDHTPNASALISDETDRNKSPSLSADNNTPTNTFSSTSADATSMSSSTDSCIDEASTALVKTAIQSPEVEKNEVSPGSFGTCKFCQTVIHSEQELQKHAKSHYNQQNRSCCLCDSVLKSSQTLRVHILKHAVELQSNNSKGHKVCCL